MSCALGSSKQQKIYRRTKSSSIVSCGIGCCSGGGSVGVAAAGCTVTVGGSWVRPGRGRRCAQASPSRLALRARGLGFAATRSRLGLCPCGSRYALAAWALPSRLSFAHTQQSNSKTAAAKAALAALLPICRSGSDWRKQRCQQRWQLRLHRLRQHRPQCQRQHQRQWQRWWRWRRRHQQWRQWQWRWKWQRQ